MPLIDTHLKIGWHPDEQELVVSDMEGTLSDGVTWKGLRDWLKANGRGADFNRFYLPRLPMGLVYNLGWVSDPQAFRERWIIGMYQQFAGFTVPEFDKVADWVVENELWPKRNQVVIAELEEHLAAGRRVILISGLAEPILAKFATKIDAEAIGTRQDKFDGRLTGKLILPFTTVHEKVNQVRHLVPEGKVFSAYGDSGADIHMLGLAKTPVAVGPDKELEEHAQTAGWRIIPRN